VESIRVAVTEIDAGYFFSGSRLIECEHIFVHGHLPDDCLERSKDPLVTRLSADAIEAADFDPDSIWTWTWMTLSEFLDETHVDETSGSATAIRTGEPNVRRSVPLGARRQDRDRPGQSAAARRAGCGALWHRRRDEDFRPHCSTVERTRRTAKAARRAKVEDVNVGTEIADNVEQHRFEMPIGDDLAVSCY
jgi:hypothetical protein